MTDKLQAIVKKMEATYEAAKKEFLKDGSISKDEADVLKSVSKKLEELKKKIAAQAKGKPAEKSSGEDQGVFDELEAFSKELDDLIKMAD